MIIASTTRKVFFFPLGLCVCVLSEWAWITGNSDEGLCGASWHRPSCPGIRGKRDWWHETHSAKDGHILCFVVMTVVVPRQRESTKRTQSSMGGLITGKTVAVVRKVENSVSSLCKGPSPNLDFPFLGLSLGFGIWTHTSNQRTSFCPWWPTCWGALCCSYGHPPGAPPSPPGGAETPVSGI